LKNIYVDHRNHIGGSRGIIRDEDGSSGLCGRPRSIEEPAEGGMHIVKEIITTQIQKFPLTCTAVGNEISNALTHWK
jgi:hypothetical protein